jgi:hypothetical protein
MSPLEYHVGRTPEVRNFVLEQSTIEGEYAAYWVTDCGQGSQWRQKRKEQQNESQTGDKS